ncbi:hypothetical protein RR48_01171 [Papilio machaon]|uniref:RRM domain-containing protein n=1 Tax=Papilio machaon TaxID=76193 RepID=A0A0N0PDX6_PAPMA|nr:hypothetical protein RR48_01171 [Papilio machaon]
MSMGNGRLAIAANPGFGPVPGPNRQMVNTSVQSQNYVRDTRPEQSSRDKISDMVIITNLPPTVTWQLIREKFSECGDVKFAEMTASDTAVVRFHKEWDAERAIRDDEYIEDEREVEVILSFVLRLSEANYLR